MGVYSYLFFILLIVDGNGQEKIWVIVGIIIICVVCCFLDGKEFIWKEVVEDIKIVRF